jgi:hypothetical protein
MSNRGYEPGAEMTGTTCIPMTSSSWDEPQSQFPSADMVFEEKQADISAEGAEARRDLDRADTRSGAGAARVDRGLPLPTTTTATTPVFLCFSNPKKASIAGLGVSYYYYQDRGERPADIWHQRAPSSHRVASLKNNPTRVSRPCFRAL